VGSRRLTAWALARPSGSIYPHFLDHCTSWKWVVSFTSQPLYLRGKSPRYLLNRGWVGPRAGVDDVEKRKFLTLLELELRPPGLPARNQSLYRLSYPGSWNMIYTIVNKSRDSSISMATVYGLDGRDWIANKDKRFSLLHSVQAGPGAHQPSYSRGTGELFPSGVRRQGHEANQSPPSSSEVKNDRTIPQLPPTSVPHGS
jgi:hypothetical protein